MRRHAVERHGAPRMILRCWLRKPDIARVTCELIGFEGTHDRIALYELAAGGVFRRRIKRHLKVDDIHGPNQRFRVGMEGQAKRTFFRSRPE
jgi:hypothetical protein